MMDVFMSWQSPWQVAGVMANVMTDMHVPRQLHVHACARSVHCARHVCVRKRTRHGNHEPARQEVWHTWVDICPHVGIEVCVCVCVCHTASVYKDGVKLGASRPQLIICGTRIVANVAWNHCNLQTTPITQTTTRCRPLPNVQ